MRARFCPDRSDVVQLRCVDDQQETEHTFGNQLWYFEGVGVDEEDCRRSVFGVVEYSVQFGLHELVEDGVSGRMVAPGDAQALAQAMVDLAGSAEERRAMGEAGRAKVCAEFDIDKEARWLKAIFDRDAGDALRPPADQSQS